MRLPMTCALRAVALRPQRGAAETRAGGRDPSGRCGCRTRGRRAGLDARRDERSASSTRHLDEHDVAALLGVDGGAGVSVILASRGEERLLVREWDAVLVG